jgi:hypothetical protein
VCGGAFGALRALSFSILRLWGDLILQRLESVGLANAAKVCTRNGGIPA